MSRHTAKRAGCCLCVGTPYFLTVGALICLVLVGLAMEYRKGPMQRFFFFQLDTVSLKRAIFHNDKSLEAVFPLHLYDWYAAGLWNSCYGSIDPDTHARIVVDCTVPHQRYWFDPYHAPGIRELVTLLKIDLHDALQLYKRASTALFYLWVFSLVGVLVQGLAGFIAMFGRGWGVLVALTTMAIGTVLFSILTDKVNDAVRDNIKIELSDDIARVGMPMHVTMRVLLLAAHLGAYHPLDWGAYGDHSSQRTFASKGNLV
ncbi:hypothetical protein KEM52_001896 [Ascosphaera acerosa]|nr:hypothetical protein KEM52_001896 [Ascosphaera acerosa]